MTTADDMQVGGDHYQKMAVQPWAAMEAWMTREQFAGYLLGSAVAYLARFNVAATGKGGLEDVQKARHCLDKLIAVSESAELHDLPPSVRRCRGCLRYRPGPVVDERCLVCVEGSDWESVPGGAVHAVGESKSKSAGLARTCRSCRHNGPRGPRHSGEWCDGCGYHTGLRLWAPIEVTQERSDSGKSSGAEIERTCLTCRHEATSGLEMRTDDWCWGCRLDKWQAKEVAK